MLYQFLERGIGVLKNHASKLLDLQAPVDDTPFAGSRQPRILSDEQILGCVGPFWDLFNRLQSGRAQGVLGLCCVPGELGLERYLRPGETRKILKSPSARFCSRWRQEAIEMMDVLERRAEIRHLVILFSAGISPSRAESVESHCLRTVRAAAGILRLSEGLEKGNILLHAWMEDERGRFRVLHPKLGVFVSPLALRGAH